MEPNANEFIVHYVTLSVIELVTVDMQITVIYTSPSPKRYLFYLQFALKQQMSQRLMENNPLLHANIVLIDTSSNSQRPPIQCWQSVYLYACTINNYYMLILEAVVCIAAELCYTE